MNIVRIIFALLLIPIASFAAYSPPVGIPAPTWGIDEVMPSRPDPWTSDVAGYYYVNYGTGIDSGRTYGNPTAPRKTVPNPILKGSYIEINGNYTHSDGGFCPFNGTGENKPNGNAWSANADGPAWITGTVDGELIGTLSSTTVKSIAYGSYLYFDGIKATYSFLVGREANVTANDHIMIRNSEFVGTGDNNTDGKPGISISGRLGYLTDSVIIYNNTSHEWGDMTLLVDTDGATGIISGPYSSNIWILENDVHNCGNVGIFVGAQTGTDPDTSINLYIGDNTVHDVNVVGVGSKNHRTMIVSENTVYNINSRPWSPGRCYGVQYDFQDTWFINNICYHSPRGFRAASSEESDDDGNDTNHEVYIVGNLFYDISLSYTCTDVTDNSSWCRETVAQQASYTAMGSNLEAAVEIAGGQEYVIANNTFYDVVSGIYSPSVSGKLHIENNIIAANGEGGYLIDIVLGVADTDIIIKDNILYQLAGTWVVKRYNTSYNTPAEVTAADADWCVEIEGVNSCTTGDPLLTNPNTTFTLQASSPAVGTGLAAASLTTDIFALFTTNYSLDIAKDIAGVSRPQQTTWDIGAYEYTPGALKGISTGSGSLNMR